ncbi:hypothetical protein MML48_9g00010758 [Holotrichia oblita]|uniref:Uncharacterized protein n=1 Tax=Holotrichia oblita TaxID=644536 RepID=A0ACB9SJC5_HOLOL|nr:hypothetical protein MML48_9g00010758 [Holotrichia oblita]
MPVDNKICSICLEICENLRNTEEIDADNIKFIAKLSFCVPELEWSGESYQLCLHCAQKLNLIYDFRKLCLKSFGYIKNEKPNQKFDLSLDNQPEYSDNDDKQGILCNDDDNLDDTIKYNKENVEIASRVCNSLLDKKFKTNRLSGIASKLSSHIKSEDTKELTCFNCNQNFNDKDDLVRHLNELHTDGKSDKCENE